MVRTVLAASLLGICTFVFGGIAILTWPIFPTGYMIQKLAVLWSWLTMKGIGARLSVSGLENLDHEQTYIFTSNHASTLDILAMLYLQPAKKFRFIAKKSLLKVPIFGWAMWLGGYIGIDRSNRKRALESTQLALRRIQEGTSVVIYPEGTRSFDGKLLPFKTGGFLMAIRAGVPIVPVTVIGSHLVQPKYRFLVQPGPFKLIFDKPIPTAGLQEKDRGPLAQRAREIIGGHLAAEGQMTHAELAAALAQPIGSHYSPAGE